MCDSDFRYASNERQMAIVLRFVDAAGFVREHFFDILNLNDYDDVSIKKDITGVLCRHGLDIHSMRGQGYAITDICSSWSGLKALFLSDCSYAYYVHNFADSLQLALASASKKETSYYFLFKELNAFGELINDSPKWQAVLQSAHKDELITGSESNNAGNLQCSENICWSYDFSSICNMMDMCGGVLTTLLKMVHDKEGSNNSVRGRARMCLKELDSFAFMFSLHLMHTIMGITDPLCRAFQEKPLDIISAVGHVSPTRTKLQNLKDEGFGSLLENVKIFCTKHEIIIPDMKSGYSSPLSRPSEQHDSITLERHYHVDVFNAGIDFQLEDLNSRFKDEIVELLKLSCALEPKENFKLFEPDHIYRLAKEFYPLDFDADDLGQLRVQLGHYKDGVVRNKRFQGLSTISELCQKLAKTRKSDSYSLIDRLIRLVLTLPVSTATTERAIHVKKHIKTALKNDMEEEFLGEYMILYIERAIVESIDTNEIIQEFESLRICNA